MLELFGHPFSSYTWKVLIALYEGRIPFRFRALSPEEPETFAEMKRLWPLAKFPVLKDDGTVLVESTVIIERLQRRHPALRLIPDDADAAEEVRLLDRIFDNHVMAPMQAFVNDALRPPERRDPVLVQEAGAALDTIYAWLDARLAGRAWAAGDTFTLADCAAAPSLFYADWVHPMGEAHPVLRAYRRRVLALPSVARAVDEARPYRHLFPLGAPDRD
jgi:glutathione S-transferase